MFFENVTRLCQQKGISVTQLAIDLKISRSNVTNWKNGSIPKSDKIQEIAAYFNVTTDYLLGNEQKNSSASEKDAEVVMWAERLKKLTPEQRKAIETIVDGFQNKK